MSKFDFRTPLIFILVGVILVLLVLMRKMDEGNKEITLEKRIEQLESKIENVKNTQKKKPPQKTLTKQKEPITKGRICLLYTSPSPRDRG